ncbi:MAG: hypothetical protein LUO97_04330 [Methanomicrobiales archaeon]|nr:hypothetical protein [Methanomicrobiales archaeon]
MSQGIFSSPGRWYLVFLVLLASCAPVLLCPATAATAVPVYSTDFSTDPGWTTNNPVTNYYDADKGMFHYYMRSGTGAYVYAPVSYSGESYTLTYDILLERTDYQASVNFGLGDADMRTDQNLAMFTEFENGQYGRILWIRSVDLTNQRREASSYFLSYGGPTIQFADGIWYHVIMDYRLESRSLTLSVYQRNDSRIVWHYTLDEINIFPTMDRITMSKVGESGNPSAIAEGYIDNVAFSLNYPAETMAATGMEPAPVTTGTTAGTTVPATLSPAESIPATEPVPLTLVPVLAALALAAICAGIALTRKR